MVESDQMDSEREALHVVPSCSPYWHPHRRLLLWRDHLLLLQPLCLRLQEIQAEGSLRPLGGDAKRHGESSRSPNRGTTPTRESTKEVEPKVNQGVGVESTDRWRGMRKFQLLFDGLFGLLGRRSFDWLGLGMTAFGLEAFGTSQDFIKRVT